MIVKLASRDSSSCLSFLMPLTRGLCGHLKSTLDTHPTCLTCAFCSRFSTCEFCLPRSSSLWESLEQRSAYSTKKKMGKFKETKEKSTKGFSSRSTRKEQGSKASGLVDPSGQSTCGLDDDSASKIKPVSSLGGVSKPRGHASEVKDTRNTGKGSEPSLLPTHRSTPTRTQPGVLDDRKYGGQVSTRPKSDFAHCETVGLDRDSEVLLLSPASPQADLPLGRPVLDISHRDKRSISPGERSVEGSTGHRSAHEVLDSRPVQIEPVQASDSGLVCSEHSVSSAPDKSARDISGPKRKESQVLHASDNADRIEELSRKSGRQTSRSRDENSPGGQDYRTTSSRHRTALDRYDQFSGSPRSVSGDHRSSRLMIPLRHTEPGILSPASKLRQRKDRPLSVDSASSSRSRSYSRSRKSKKKDKKKRRHSPSSSSSSSRRPSSSSRERRKRHHKKKSRKSRSYKRSSHAKKRKRRSPSSSSSSSVTSPCRSPSKKDRAQSLDGSSSETPSHRIIRPVRNSSPVQDVMSIHADDNFFSQEEDRPDNQSVDDPTLGSEQEKVDYITLVDEVYKLLPSDRFPRKTNVAHKQPRSAIELDLMLEIQNSAKDVSFAQSNCTKGAFDCIKSSMGVEPDKDGVFQNPVSVPKDWCPENKNLKELISLSKSYQSHNETIPTARATKLDPNAHRLGLSLTGTFPVKVASLDMYERLARESIKVLSHAETFSYAAFKSLQQEEMDTRILTKILESVSIAIRDCFSISTVQALALQQTRREAAISSASKPLSEMTKQKLRSVPLNSSLLFGNQIEEIYRENTDSNREDLVNNAATQLSKLNKFSSLPKPKSKPGKKKTGPKAQETPKPQFAPPNQPSRSSRGGTSNRGFNPRGRESGPSHRGASSSRKH